MTRSPRCCVRCALVTGALLIALAAGACSPPDLTDPGPERYARRFTLPHPPEWQLESTLPEGPQKSPPMVIWEVSKYAPGTQPTPGQRRAAADLVERSERAARKKGWEDIEKGLADGFTMIPGDGTHYFNEEFIMDDQVLDPERPEFLMYYNTPTGRRLVGYMYRVRDLADRGPQTGGPLTVWHYHVWDHVACLRPNKLPTGQPAQRGRCQQGLVPSHRSPEMVHVWFIDRPQGPFATDMAIDPAEAVKQLERKDRERRAS